MKLIVGLGNPGPKYRGTRHNIGFAVADELARRIGIEFETAPAEALMARWRQQDTLIVKPLTFMNASGEAVGALMRYFKIDRADLLVITDEVQLPLARLRARPQGSAGGHNGLKSIIAHVGEDFSRLRIGIGRGAQPGGGVTRTDSGSGAGDSNGAGFTRDRVSGSAARGGRRDLADYVLATFDKEERPEVDRVTARAADAAEMFITSGIAAVMNAFNGGDSPITE